MRSGSCSEAEAVHRDDPRLVAERFALEIDTRTDRRGRGGAGQLERLAPGDVRVWRGRAALLARQGKLAEAAEMQGGCVRERPSWRNLWYLADVEIDLGRRRRRARRTSQQLLQVSPGNPRGLAKMAELEWKMGDPREAARIYEGLLEGEGDAAERSATWAGACCWRATTGRGRGLSAARWSWSPTTC